LKNSEDKSTRQQERTLLAR